MTKEEAIQVLESMKSEESYNALIDLCNIAIEALQTDAVSREMYDDVVQTIIKREKQFTNMVSVVRCKDCKHYIVEGITTRYGWCHEYKHSVDEDDYCSYGERKK